MLRRPALAALTLVSACAAPMLPAPAPGEPPPPRAPDGVSLDLPSARPALSAVGGPAGTVSLAFPITAIEVDAVVRGYLRAFASGDFAGLLTPDARQIQGRGGTDPLLMQSLNLRLRSVDYSHMPADVATLYSAVRVTPVDLVPAARASAFGTRAGDVLLDVPMKLEPLGSARMFGATIQLLVRRVGADGGRSWLIAGVHEADGPWG
jgi:hypothetical protein